MVKSGLLLFLLSAFVVMIECKGDEPKPNEKALIKAYVKDSILTKKKVLKITVDTDSVLYVLFTKINTNNTDTLSKGKSVTINSVGRFLDGKKLGDIFDNYPLTFVLGSGTVITGLDAGVAQMKKGEKTIIICTSLIGYGDAKPYGSINAKGRLVLKDNLGKILIDTVTKLPKFEYKNIPANTPLVFEVEVVK